MSMEIENPQNILQPTIQINPKVVIYASLGNKYTDPFEIDRNNYIDLKKQLELKFKKFHCLYFLDGNLKPSVIDSDAEFTTACTLNQNVRLFLRKQHFTKLDLELITQSVSWLGSLKTDDLSKYLEYLEILHTLGYKSWRRNLKLLYNSELNLGLVIESLTTGKKIENKPKEKVKREKRPRSETLNKNERKRGQKRPKLEDKDNEELTQALDEKVKNKEKGKMLRKVALEAYVSLDEWPGTIKNLFIDGNNLMFVSEKLRILTLNKQRKKVQHVLNYVTESFAKITRDLNATIVFDYTSQTTDPQDLENGSKFSVISAKPQYKTSDELLIDWSKKNLEMAGSTAVVTADRALAGELKLSGVILIKPMVWLTFVANEIVGKSMDPKEWLDALADQDEQHPY